MDAISCRSTQGNESAADSGDWKSQLLPESREKIALKIMDNLKKCIPHNDGPEGLHELKKLATKFEEKIFFAATNQTDYLRQISLKMLAMESHKLTANSMPTDSVVRSSQNPQDSGSNSMQAQVVNQGQQMPMQTGNTQVQERQQIQNSVVPGGVPGSSGLTSAMSSISGLPSTSIPNVASQNPNVQSIQNMPGVPQNLVGNAMGQGVSSSMPQQQRQIQGRQQITPQQQQQQQKQQSQNQQNYLYQQQQLLMKSKYQQGKISHSVMQSHLQQQAQQHPNIVQSSQQSSVMQSGSLSGLQQNQQISGQQPTQTGMQQNSQSVFRQQQQQQQQTSMIHQQQNTVQSMQQQQSNATNMRQTSMIRPQQQTVQSMQQHQLSNATNMQQNLTGQQNSISDMQQQQQRMLSQQNNLPNMQQQRLTSQTNNLPNMRHQQMNSLNNAVRLPQQSLVTQSGSSNMLTNQHTLQMMQQSKVPLQPQSQHGNTTVFPSLGQPSSHQSMAQIQSQTGQLQQQLGMQQQPSSHQSMTQIQPQTGQLQQQLSMQQQQQLSMQQQQQLGMQHQQQLGMQQQPNLVQRDMQQRLQTSGPLLQQQNKIDPQKHLALSEASSTSLDSTVQKGTANSEDWQEETYQKIKAMKDAYLSDLVEMYQRISAKLQQHDPVSEPSQNEQSEKLLLFKTMVERIIVLLQIPKCNVLPVYREKLPLYEKQIINVLASNKPQYKQGSTMPPGQQPGQYQMQSMQQQTHDNQINAQLQQTGVQNSMSTIPQNSMTDQGNHLNNMLEVSVGSLQQNPMSAPQQANLNTLQPNFSSVQSNASMLPSQKMLQTKPLNQQRQMQQQLVHRQIQQEQQTQQLNQQKQAQFQSQQMSQMNEINDLNLRQQLAPISGIQRSAYQHLQTKSNTSKFPISSPQILQTAASPQVLQQPSPQIDQQNILSSLTRTGTPLQSTNSPLIVPSPSTPFVPSPMPGDSEKVGSGVGNIRQSLAIGTPGISASPLLESTSQEIHANASTVVSGKSNVTELPMDRLIRVVKSMSPSALSDSVSDIGSIVGMFDGIAGSAPGNGSRAAVGEDLAAMTKFRLQANNISMQDGFPGTRKMKRYTTASSVISNEDSDSDSVATSYFKRPRLADNHSLLEEIREINEQLIDTVVDISDEKLDHTADPAEGGTIVKCSYSAVSLSPTFKSQYASHQMLSIQPLRLLVPQNYPNCSPIFLDKFLTEPSKESEDLSVKAQLRFSIHVRNLSQPMSLGEIAKTWDLCSREVIIEYAQQNGGGTFTSKYGSWGNGLSTV
ncbi:mediator of RNA polymerase II transcription subunit 15a-like isoform X2 [Impatiens glandulifera]|uniref:mediator of RNA polymerase II transcription subunit 15a-like isoform X2 n=1 Tax=Impatiens glandulifera TaxID=253017 RepID=UPI001FB066D1|nr:mediator of RNA polymerase II transcription subunit 15a-like isoform X2 [Impatiens glandulifera]